MALFLVGLFLVRALGDLWAFFGSGSYKIIMDIRNDMFQTVLVPVQTIERTTTGKIISKFTYDATNVAHSLGNIITIMSKILYWF